MKGLTTYAVKYNELGVLTDFKEIPYSSLSIAQAIIDGFTFLPPSIEEKLGEQIAIRNRKLQMKR